MKKIKLAVIGGPALKISRSAEVHQQFGMQNGVDVSMDVFQIESSNDLIKKLHELQEADYLGVSIAQPYKEVATTCCDKLSEQAKSAGAVNVIKFCQDGDLLGDNTDGLGLIRDIENQYDVSFKDKRVLLIGAGGVAHGLLVPLFAKEPRDVIVVNRSNKRTLDMLAHFKQERQSTNFRASISGFEKLDGDFGIIINTTSASLEHKLPGELPSNILKASTLCYDVVLFADEPTVFEAWAMHHGARHANGLGMIVEQAAIAFLLWTGLCPKDTPAVLQRLRKQ
jgi:shikimate dehydrogenase